MNKQDVMKLLLAKTKKHVKFTIVDISLTTEYFDQMRGKDLMFLPMLSKRLDTNELALTWTRSNSNARPKYVAKRLYSVDPVYNRLAALGEPVPDNIYVGPEVYRDLSQALDFKRGTYLYVAVLSGHTIPSSRASFYITDPALHCVLLIKLD